MLPRPNPGPDPTPGPPPVLGWLVAAGVALAIVMAARRGFGRRGPPTAPVPPSEGTTPPTMEALCGRVRSALVGRLGAGWAARTTQELAGDPALGSAFGPGQSARLAEFLEAADRAKFAGAPDHGADWAAWVEEFVEAAGATSTINGR